MINVVMIGFLISSYTHFANFQEKRFVLFITNTEFDPLFNHGFPNA